MFVFFPYSATIMTEKELDVLLKVKLPILTIVGLKAKKVQQEKLSDFVSI